MSALDKLLRRPSKEEREEMERNEEAREVWRLTSDIAEAYGVRVNEPSAWVSRAVANQGLEHFRIAKPTRTEDFSVEFAIERYADFGEGEATGEERILWITGDVPNQKFWVHDIADAQLPLEGYDDVQDILALF